MSLLEVILWFLSLILGFILGWLTNWYFYRKQLKENEVSTEILKQLKQHDDAEIRLGDDKRGKIVKNKEGNIAIVWSVDCSEKLSISDGTNKGGVDE